MKYKKFLIVASKKDPAGVNMSTHLSQFQQASNAGGPEDFRFYLVDDEIIYTKNLDAERINQADFVIFVSKHAAKSTEDGYTKTLSVHAPGNWREARYGGQPRKVCKTSAFFMKQAFEQIDKNMKEYNLKDYELTLEATHHGPLIDKPCVFIEIGPTEKEWTDRRAGFIMARAITDTIKNFHEDKYNEIAIAIGGPHYCPSFNKIQLASNIAISHIIPRHAFPITEDMVREAVEGTEEEVDLAVLDWKGLGNADQRKEVTDALDKVYLRYEKTSDVGKN